MHGKKSSLFSSARLIIVIASLILSGCAALHTSIAKQDLEIQTRMSQSIFLDPPTTDNQKTVYIQVHNTSTKQDLDIEPNLHWALTKRGYTILPSPTDAHYMVQANVLRVSKINVRELNSDLDAGFGGALIGATLAGATGGNGGAMIGAGLAGAMMGVAIDAMTQDIYYTIVTDVQISERKKASSKQKDAWQRYQTRIVSTANKVNLKFNEAMPELAYEVSSSIAGLM